MKLRKIVLAFAGALLLSNSAALSQDKLKFDVYNDWLLGINLNMHSSLRVSPEKIDFSFLFNSYSMEFKQLTDSTYQEIVKDNWEKREEFFNYLKSSGYMLLNYSAKKGTPRAEKEALEERLFNKKYESVTELVERFQKGLINDKDSIHFIVLGLPYSTIVNKRENKDSIIYSGKLEVKRDSGDSYVLSKSVEIYVIKKNGKEIPVGFSTALSHAKKNKKISIEGRLRED